MKTVKLTIEVPEIVARLLAVLDEERSAAKTLVALADHAQQGVYRPGAWEREWVMQAFGTHWLQRLTAGDPYGRKGCESIFQRPRLAKKGGGQ